MDPSLIPCPPGMRCEIIYRREPLEAILAGQTSALIVLIVALVVVAIIALAIAWNTKQ